MRTGALRTAGLLCAALAFALSLAVAALGGVLGASSSKTAATLDSVLAAAGDGCVTTGTVADLSASQAAMAADVVAAAMAVSGENLAATRIAVMTADTESGLVDLGPETGNDGSLGLFQQRAAMGWGTPAEELDPTTSTGMFVSRLLAVRDWESMRPWVAAEAVQRSSFTGVPSASNGHSSVVGGNYRSHWAASGTILAAVETDQTAAGCGQGIPGGLSGPASAHGLPAGYQIPAGTGPAHTTAVRFALAQLGRPYLWGAAGPAAYDCSGLTMAAWAAAGVTLDHYTVDQQHQGTPVNAAELQAGDLVLTPGTDSPGPGLAGHVGIYLGYGLVESAVDPQVGVVVQSWSLFVSGGIDALIDPEVTDG